MPNCRRHVRWLGLASLAMALVACNKSPTSPSDGSSPTPPVPGAATVYAAVGASDAIGIGGSVLCTPYTDCPNGTGYVPTIARQLRAEGATLSLMNLGIPGAVIGPDVQAVASANGDIALNFLDGEMPFVPRDATVVTIFAGPNDVRTIAKALDRGAGGSNPAGYIDAQVAAFAADYKALIAGIRARAPKAWIVAANLPNFAGLPYTGGYSGQQKQFVQKLSVDFTRSVINALTAQSIPVVDLMCDPRSYQGAIYSSDGFHPNDTGYAYIASKFLDAIKTSSYPAPQGACAQMAIVPPL